MIIPSCKYAPLLYSSSSSFVLGALYSVIIVITSASDDWLHTFVWGRQQQNNCLMQKPGSGRVRRSLLCGQELLGMDNASKQIMTTLDVTQKRKASFFRSHNNMSLLEYLQYDSCHDSLQFGNTSTYVFSSSDLLLLPDSQSLLRPKY